MSGVPLPAGDVPVGTITVRVVRGSMANPLTGESVELQGGASPLTMKTNAEGRAEFSGLTPGTLVKAIAMVNGERLESQEIQMPSSSGMRVALVATDPEMAKRAEQDRSSRRCPPSRASSCWATRAGSSSRLETTA